MAPRGFDPRRLDVATFATAGAEIGGEILAETLPRLVAATLAPADDLPRAPIEWHIVGERLLLAGAGARPALSFRAWTDVTLECQRCLQRMTVALRPERRLFFVEGEDAAAALDAESDDDVLALTPALDLPALIEDELLLALPLVPRHAACPEPLPHASGDDDPAAAASDHPFAMLAALKQGPRPS